MALTVLRPYSIGTTTAHADQTVIATTLAARVSSSRPILR